VHRLGTELMGKSGVADQVAEQHGHLAPLSLSGDGRSGRGEPMAAGGAELMIGLDREAARRAAPRQPRAAPGAEPGSLWTIEAAAGAAHP
jgi:hypothetical protein